MILIITLMCVLFLFLISSSCIESFNDTEVPYVLTTNEIKKSDIGHRGVFASKDYKAGETLEVCPCIKHPYNILEGKIQDYIFDFDEDNVLIAFGYCSMYNHVDNPNAEWEVLNENQLMIKAIKDIKKDEEIFVSYGDDYWTSRRNATKNNI